MKRKYREAVDLHKLILHTTGVAVMEYVIESWGKRTKREVADYCEEVYYYKAAGKVMPPALKRAISPEEKEEVDLGVGVDATLDGRSDGRYADYRYIRHTSNRAIMRGERDLLPQ